MSDLSRRLQRPLVQPAQAQKHVTVNEALLQPDLPTQCVVQSAAIQAQPDSPVDSVVHILPPGKTGAAWGGMADYALAAHQDSAWREITPKPGWAALVLDQGETLVFENGRWCETRARPTSPSRRNLFINGALRLWRRGDTIAHVGSSRTFGRDGFFVDSSDPAASLTLSRVAVTTGGPAGARYALRIACTAKPAGAVLRLVQRVEDVATLAGGPAVASLWARASKAFTQAAVTFTQRFGTGGSSAVASSAIPLQAQPGTAWVRVFAAADLPCVIGKTIGAGDNLEVALDLSNLAAGDWIEIALPQLEQGADPTPFDCIRPDVDLMEA
jgi:hypothetical protein